MKFARFGILTAALALLAIGAGTASADRVTSPAGTTFTGTVKWASDGHVILHEPFKTIECNFATEGTIDSHGPGVTVGGPITSMTTSNCTSEVKVTVLKLGSFTIAATGSGNGTMSMTGTEIKVSALGIDCIYSTSKTVIGTVTGGTPAKVDLSGTLPRTGGSAFCGSSAPVTGELKVVNPSPFILDVT